MNREKIEGIAHKYRFANNEVERLLCEISHFALAADTRATDAEAAAALVIEKAADLLDTAEHDAEERDWRSGANAFCALAKAIRALASPPGVEELARLRAELARWKIGSHGQAWDRITAEAEAAQLRADLEAAHRDLRAINHMAKLNEDEIRLLTGPNDGVTINNLGYQNGQIREWSGRYLPAALSPKEPSHAPDLAEGA